MHRMCTLGTAKVNMDSRLRGNDEDVAGLKALDPGLRRDDGS